MSSTRLCRVECNLFSPGVQTDVIRPCLRGTPQGQAQKVTTPFLFRGPIIALSGDVGVPGFKGRFLCDLQQKIRAWSSEANVYETVEHNSIEVYFVCARY